MSNTKGCVCDLNSAFEMKTHWNNCGIWMLVLLVAALVAACNSTVVEPEEEPCRELEEIDSLMWKQPDSAFARLRVFAASSKADSLDVFNGHYCQLLISELLYKNYYEQSNREELLKAVNFFDSLMMDNRQGAGKLRAEEQERNVFLDARAHYINGVGFYERGNEVLACEEYLKALGLMEDFFDENDLMGNRAVFMFYTYNRLLSLFSSQFMMDPAIACGENALGYCRKEPSLTKEIPNTYFFIGKQYDKKGERDVARYYYEQAIEGLSDINNLVYRDVVSTKALCDFQDGLSAEDPLTTIRKMLYYAACEKERLTRFLAIGSIFTVEQSFDSAVCYLEPVFENQDYVSLQIQAAEYLLINYEHLGNEGKKDECILFLGDHKKPEGEDMAMVSKLEDSYKGYLNKKQKKEAEAERRDSVRNTIRMVVPIAVVVVLAIIILAKLKSKKLLKEQQEEADRILGKTEQQHKEELKRRQAEAEKTLEDKEKHHQQEMEAKEAQARKELEEREKQHAEVLEAERQTHRMEQAAISGRLKRSNRELRELKDQIKQMDDSVAKTEKAVSFDEEPICRLIMDRVNEGQFKSKIDYIIYKDSALDKQQLLDLRLAVDRHFGQFTVRLNKAYPELTNGDLDYCCLYLLGLTDADIAALMQRTYNTVFERNGKMRKIFGSETPLPITLMGMANDSSFI